MEFAEDFGQSRKWGEIGENWGKLGKIGENRENRENPNFRKNPRKSENNTLARKTPSI
jgi:hypothetical protein